MSKPRIVIHMGASAFTAKVRHNDQIILFDFNRMEPKQKHIFRRALVKAYKEASETN